MEELRADAVVHPDSAADVLHVGADFLTQIGHLVDEGDLGREEGIGGVLDQLRTAPADEQDRRFVQKQRPVDLAHGLASEIVLGADDDPVGALEVADRRAFAQEFGVRDDRDLMPAAALGDDPLDFVAGADRHGRFGDDDRIVLERFAHFARHGMDERQVGMPVTAPTRRAYGDEDCTSAGDALGQVRGERQAAGLDVGLDQRIEPGLVDRHHAFMQPVDLRLVLVDADNIMPEIGETGARNKADIARPNHCDFHRLNPKITVPRLLSWTVRRCKSDWETSPMPGHL